MVNASQALPALGSQENNVVGEELTKLDQALNRSSRILADILSQHQRAQDDDLPPALGLVQVNAILPSLHELVEGLKTADQHANASLNGSQSHLKSLTEHKNQYLKPVNAIFKSVQVNVDAEKSVLKANVNKTTIEAELAKEESEELSLQVQEKQTEISAHEEDLQRKRMEVNELETRAKEALQKSDKERKEAERLRDKAETRVGIGIFVAIASLGTLSPLSAALILDAKEKFKAADAARERASELEREFWRLNSSKAKLEDHFSQLQSEMGQLRAEKREVENDVKRHENRHGTLEKRLEQIKEQVDEAKSFAVEVEVLQTEFEKLGESSKRLRDSLGKLSKTLRNVVVEVQEQETLAAAAQRRANRPNIATLPMVVMERLMRVRLSVEPLRLSVREIVRERRLLRADTTG